MFIHIITTFGEKIIINTDHIAHVKQLNPDFQEEKVTCVIYLTNGEDIKIYGTISEAMTLVNPE